jgi:hypothetical protein
MLKIKLKKNQLKKKRKLDITVKTMIRVIKLKYSHKK